MAATEFEPRASLFCDAAEYPAGWPLTRWGPKTGGDSTQVVAAIAADLGGAHQGNVVAPEGESERTAPNEDARCRTAEHKIRASAVNAVPMNCDRPR